MARVPSAVWIVDTKKEHIAVGEARKLGIPVVAILDTNCDPDEVDYKIPGNDDAIRSVTLLTRVIADAVAEGLMARVRAARDGDEKPATASSPPTSRWPSGSRSCCSAVRRAEGTPAPGETVESAGVEASGTANAAADTAAPAEAAAPAAEAPRHRGSGRGRGPAASPRPAPATEAAGRPRRPTEPARRGTEEA